MSFFRARKDACVRRYTTTPVLQLLRSVRSQTLPLVEFNRALWEAIPQSTILLEYRGDHRVPFSIHDQLFMNEVAAQRLSRPIFKVRGVPPSIDAATLVDGFLETITPLSSELTATRDYLVPRVKAPDKESLLELALWQHLGAMLCGGPELLAHVGLSSPTHTDSAANLLFNRLSSVVGTPVAELDELDAVLLSRYYESLRDDRELLTKHFKRACSEVAT